MPRKTLKSRCPCLHGNDVEEVTTLDYRHCSLEHVPAEVFNVERTLEELYVDSNQIRDLPRELFYCHGLRRLNISDNDIITIPSAIDSLTNLEHLDFCKNGVVDFPASIKNCKHLRYIEASVNPLGKLSDGLTQLLNLTELFLNDTFLDYLPGSFGRLTKLRVLEVRENHLKTLPRSMNRLTSLERLDIGKNDFTDMPEVVCSIPSLIELWCDCNRISSVPNGIGTLQQLIYLDASENRIETLSPHIDRCRALADLYLSSNLLQQLPEAIGRLSNLTALKVDDNRLTDLPFSIGGLVSLSELNITANDLEHLPPSIGFLRHLRTLYADENFIYEIPAELGSCSGLTVLSLRSNNLEVVPDELGRIPRLRVLNLSDNKIRNLPYSMTRLKELQALWLSENQTKPLIRLQPDLDSETGERILTCYLLPQQHTDDQEDMYSDGDSFHPSMWEEERQQRCRIHFDDDLEIGEGGFSRQPTPYPKEMKNRVQHMRNLAMKQSNLEPAVPGTSSQGAGGGAGGTDPSEQTELLPGCGDRSPERRDGERSPERSPERHPERHNLLRADKQKNAKDKARMSKNRKSNEPPEEPQTGTDDGGFLADEVRPGVSRKPSMRDDRSGVSTVRSSRSAQSVADSMHSGGGVRGDGGGVRYNSIPGGDGARVTGDGGVNSVSYEDFSRGLDTSNPQLSTAMPPGGVYYHPLPSKDHDPAHQGHRRSRQRPSGYESDNVVHRRSKRRSGSGYDSEGCKSDVGVYRPDMSMTSMRTGAASDVGVPTRIQGRQATRQPGQPTTFKPGQPTTFKPIPPHAKYDSSFQPTSQRSSGHQKSGGRSKDRNHAPSRGSNGRNDQDTGRSEGRSAGGTGALRSDEKYAAVPTTSVNMRPKVKVPKHASDMTSNKGRSSGEASTRSSTVMSDAGQRSSGTQRSSGDTEVMVSRSRGSVEQQSHAENECAPERPPMPKENSQEKPRELPPYRHPPPAPQRLLQAHKDATDGGPMGTHRPGNPGTPETPSNTRWGSRKSIDHNSNQITAKDDPTPQRTPKVAPADGLQQGQQGAWDGQGSADPEGQSQGHDAGGGRVPKGMQKLFSKEETSSGASSTEELYKQQLYKASMKLQKTPSQKRERTTSEVSVVDDVFLPGQDDQMSSSPRRPPAPSSLRGAPPGAAPGGVHTPGPGAHLVAAGLGSMRISQHSLHTPQSPPVHKKPVFLPATPPSTPMQHPGTPRVPPDPGAHTAHTSVHSVLNEYKAKLQHTPHNAPHTPNTPHNTPRGAGNFTPQTNRHENPQYNTPLVNAAPYNTPVHPGHQHAIHPGTPHRQYSVNNLDMAPSPIKGTPYPTALPPSLIRPPSVTNDSRAKSFDHLPRNLNVSLDCKSVYSEQGVTVGVTQQYVGRGQEGRGQEGRDHPTVSQYEENVAMFKHVQNPPVSQVSSSADSGYGHGVHLDTHLSNTPHETRLTHAPHETRPSPGKDSAVSGLSRESTPGRNTDTPHASYPPRVQGQPHVFSVSLKKNPGLGFSISGGLGSPGNPFRPHDDGIFISKVNPGGPALTVLQEGDKILQVNEIDFREIEHTHAVDVLRSCDAHVAMVIERL